MLTSTITIILVKSDLPEPADLTKRTPIIVPSEIEADRSLLASSVFPEVKLKVPKTEGEPAGSLTTSTS